VFGVEGGVEDKGRRTSGVGSCSMSTCIVRKDICFVLQNSRLQFMGLVLCLASVFKTNYSIRQRVVLHSDITEPVEDTGSVCQCLMLDSEFIYQCKVLYSYSHLILYRVQLNHWQYT
jgi:hypothetical protein